MSFKLIVFQLAELLWAFQGKWQGSQDLLISVVPEARQADYPSDKEEGESIEECRMAARPAP